LGVSCEGAAARYRLAIAYKGAEIVGVGAVKRVRRGYAKQVSIKSDVIFPSDRPELGYVAVAPDHQRKGLSRRIADALLSQRTGSLFATTENDYMKKTLSQAGFSKKGKERRGRRATLSYWESILSDEPNQKRKV